MFVKKVSKKIIEELFVIYVGRYNGTYTCCFDYPNSDLKWGSNGSNFDRQWVDCRYGIQTPRYTQTQIRSEDFKKKIGYPNLHGLIIERDEPLSGTLKFNVDRRL